MYSRGNYTCFEIKVKQIYKILHIFWYVYKFKNILIIVLKILRGFHITKHGESEALAHKFKLDLRARAPLRL